MNLLGVSPTTWAVGLAGLAAALFALHLLRVRLRRQTVDSLLFFRQVGAVRKPRVLLGVPARWLSFALGLLLLAALWTAFARPRVTSDGPSRVVVVDTSATAATLSAGGAPVGARLVERATELVDEGLGPRGRVIAFGAVPGSLWSADEPSERIEERSAARADTETSLWRTLADAARDLGPEDEIVLLGGPEHLPSTIGRVALRRDAAARTEPVPVIVAVRAQHREMRVLDVDVATGGTPVVVEARRGDEVLAAARAETPAGSSTRVRLGPLPDGALELQVGVRADGGARTEVGVTLPERRRLRVHVADELPEAVRLAVEADARCTLVDLTTAEVAIVRGGTPLPAMPSLIIDPGVGAAPRAPRSTAACPIPLGLRDRTRSTAAALGAVAGSEVWIEDAASGAPLLVAEFSGSSGRIRAVSWLLDGGSHRDVPVLVLGAIHELAPEPPVEVRTALAYRPGGATDTAELADLRGAFPLLPALLAAGLVLLALDVWLHHRGRTA